MRHLKRNNKLGRKGDHRNAMLANMACSLIKHSRITTTVDKAKAARQVVEKLITLGRDAIGADKAQGVHLRRLAAAKVAQAEKVVGVARACAKPRPWLLRLRRPRRQKRRPAPSLQPPMRTPRPSPNSRGCRRKGRMGRWTRSCSWTAGVEPADVERLGPWRRLRAKMRM